MKATFKFSKDYSYIAEDADGSQYIFNAKPIKHDTCWNINVGRTVLVEYGKFNLGGNWKESLYKINHKTGELEKVKILPDFKVDTKVLVRDKNSSTWQKRYFKRFDDAGHIVTFIDGQTSWTSPVEYYEHTWTEWMLPDNGGF